MQLITSGMMIVCGIAIWVDKSCDIEDLRTWRQSHEQLHKERLVEVKTIEARADERFKSIEVDVRRLSAKAENLDYRMTSSEQVVGSLVQTTKDIQQAVSAQSGDLREIKLIVQRMEKCQRP